MTGAAVYIHLIRAVLPLGRLLLLFAAVCCCLLQDQEEAGEFVMYAKLVNVALVHPPQALVAVNHPVAAEVYPHLYAARNRSQQQQAHPKGRRGAKLQPLQQLQQQGTADSSYSGPAASPGILIPAASPLPPTNQSSASAVEGSGSSASTVEEKTPPGLSPQPLKLAKSLRAFSVRIELRDW